MIPIHGQLRAIDNICVGLTVNVLVGKESGGSFSASGRLLKVVLETGGKVTIVCDRLLVAFMFVDASVRFAVPSFLV